MYYARLRLVVCSTYFSDCLGTRMLFFSSSGIKKTNIIESIECLVDIGIKNIELSGGTQFQDKTIETLLELKEKHCLNYLVHNYFPPPAHHFVLNIGSHEQKERLTSVDFARGSIDLAYQLGVGIYTIHAGYCRKYAPNKKADGYFVAVEEDVADYETTYQMMWESLNVLKPYADERKIRVGVENLFPIKSGIGRNSILCTQIEILRFLDDLNGNPTLGMLMDFGHLNICAHQFGFDAGSLIDTISDRYMHHILEIHLSGNDGKQDLHKPLEKDDWQLQALKNMDTKTIPITLEYRSLAPEKIYDSYDIIHQYL